MHIKFWMEKLNRRDHFEDLGIWKDNIRMDLREKGCGLDASVLGLGKGPVPGPFGHSNEPLNYIKGGQFLD
jgi:hypothetical protein